MLINPKFKKQRDVSSTSFYRSLESGMSQYKVRAVIPNLFSSGAEHVLLLTPELLTRLYKRPYMLEISQTYGIPGAFSNQHDILSFI